MGKHTPAPWRILEQVRNPLQSGWVKLDIQVGPFGCMQRDDALHAIACVNACEGIDPATVPELVKALNGLLVQALQSNVNASNNEWGAEAIAVARAALAKVEGGE